MNINETLTTLTVFSNENKPNLALVEAQDTLHRQLAEENVIVLSVARLDSQTKVVYLPFGGEIFAHTFDLEISSLSLYSDTELLELVKGVV